MFLNIIPHITLAITQDHHLNKKKLEKVVLKSIWMGSRESVQQFLEKADQAKHQGYYRFPKQKLNVCRIPCNPEKIMISKTGSFSPKGQFRSSSVFKRITNIFHCWHRDQSWVPSVGPEAITPNDKNCHTKITLECIVWGPNFTSYIWTKHSGAYFQVTGREIHFWKDRKQIPNASALV